MFKIFKRNKSLKIIFQTFIATLPALANVGSLMLLFLYMYSILGVFLFAHVKLSEPLDKVVNFQSIGYSLMTLFRIATGEKWNEIVHALIRQNSPAFQCIDSPTFEDYKRAGKHAVGCGVPWAALFVVSFILIVMLIFLNLFVAVILQGFEETDQKNSKKFNAETTDQFRDTWARFDPNGTSFIKRQDFIKFMLALGEPLGWDVSFLNNPIKQKRFLKRMNISLHNEDQEYQF